MEDCDLKVMWLDVRLTKGRLVMVNIDCQCDRIWNHPGDKRLDREEGVYRVRWEGPY